MDVDDSRIVVNCPTCKRTIWANATCLHGDPPPPVGGPNVEETRPVPPYSSKTNRKNLKGGLE